MTSLKFSIKIELLDIGVEKNVETSDHRVSWGLVDAYLIFTSMSIGRLQSHT
jgi:hypothetical protein